MQSGATIGGEVIENHDRFGGCRTARNYRLKNPALLARPGTPSYGPASMECLRWRASQSPARAI